MFKDRQRQFGIEVVDVFRDESKSTETTFHGRIQFEHGGFRHEGRFMYEYSADNTGITGFIRSVLGRIRYDGRRKMYESLDYAIVAVDRDDMRIKVEPFAVRKHKGEYPKAVTFEGSLYVLTDEKTKHDEPIYALFHAQEAHAI